MQEIQYVGLKDLSKIEESTVKSLSEKYYDKLIRGLQNAMSLKVHVKTYSQEGKRKKYAISSTISAPTKIIEAHTDDWDLSRTLHKVFKDLEREIEHRFHK